MHHSFILVFFLPLLLLFTTQRVSAFALASINGACCVLLTNQCVDFAETPCRTGFEGSLWLGAGTNFSADGSKCPRNCITRAISDLAEPLDGLDGDYPRSMYELVSTNPDYEVGVQDDVLYPVGFDIAGNFSDCMDDLPPSADFGKRSVWVYADKEQDTGTKPPGQCGQRASMNMQSIGIPGFAYAPQEGSVYPDPRPSPGGVNASELQTFITMMYYLNVTSPTTNYSINWVKGQEFLGRNDMINEDLNEFPLTNGTWIGNTFAAKSFVGEGNRLSVQVQHEDPDSRFYFLVDNVTVITCGYDDVGACVTGSGLSSVCNDGVTEAECINTEPGAAFFVNISCGSPVIETGACCFEQRFDESSCVTDRTFSRDQCLLEFVSFLGNGTSCVANGTQCPDCFSVDSDGVETYLPRAIFTNGTQTGTLTATQVAIQSQNFDIVSSDNATHVWRIQRPRDESDSCYATHLARYLGGKQAWAAVTPDPMNPANESRCEVGPDSLTTDTDDMILNITDITQTRCSVAGMSTIKFRYLYIAPPPGNGFGLVELITSANQTVNITSQLESYDDVAVALDWRPFFIDGLEGPLDWYALRLTGPVTQNITFMVDNLNLVACGCPVGSCCYPQSRSVRSNAPFCRNGTFEDECLKNVASFNVLGGVLTPVWRQNASCSGNLTSDGCVSDCCTLDRNGTCLGGEVDAPACYDLGGLPNFVSSCQLEGDKCPECYRELATDLENFASTQQIIETANFLSYTVTIPGGMVTVPSLRGFVLFADEFVPSWRADVTPEDFYGYQEELLQSFWRLDTPVQPICVKSRFLPGHSGRQMWTFGYSPPASGLVALSQQNDTNGYRPEEETGDAWSHVGIHPAQAPDSLVYRVDVPKEQGCGGGGGSTISRVVKDATCFGSGDLDCFVNPVRFDRNYVLQINIPPSNCLENGIARRFVVFKYILGLRGPTPPTISIATDFGAQIDTNIYIPMAINPPITNTTLFALEQWLPFVVAVDSRETCIRLVVSGGEPNPFISEMYMSIDDVQVSQCDCPKGACCEQDGSCQDQVFDHECLTEHPYNQFAQNLTCAQRDCRAGCCVLNQYGECGDEVTLGQCSDFDIRGLVLGTTPERGIGSVDNDTLQCSTEGACLACSAEGCVNEDLENYGSTEDAVDSGVWNNSNIIQLPSDDTNETFIQSLPFPMYVPYFNESDLNATVPDAKNITWHLDTSGCSPVIPGRSESTNTWTFGTYVNDSSCELEDARMVEPGFGILRLNIPPVDERPQCDANDTQLYLRFNFLLNFNISNENDIGILVSENAFVPLVNIFSYEMVGEMFNQTLDPEFNLTGVGMGRTLPGQRYTNTNQWYSYTVPIPRTEQESLLFIVGMDGGNVDTSQFFRGQIFIDDVRVDCCGGAAEIREPPGPRTYAGYPQRVCCPTCGKSPSACLDGPFIF